MFSASRPKVQCRDGSKLFSDPNCMQQQRKEASHAVPNIVLGWAHPTISRLWCAELSLHKIVLRWPESASHWCIVSILNSIVMPVLNQQASFLSNLDSYLGWLQQLPYKSPGLWAVFCSSKKLMCLTSVTWVIVVKLDYSPFEVFGVKFHFYKTLSKTGHRYGSHFGK